ncbi:putative Glucose-methanol-choline (GMC) oxidoreductase family protein [Hibiscus syriacus]|uniref:Glucose-methanol-choline (GMC) oxidoreductase family protein n=2 Tax=Hibiscus syriacus TaxID=106335 RepID=A0A6A3AJG6_HIBSY|nr:putative Glucose-methanol-choline (GMC) oxidoreductase family protein [Hibiscus syriacus]
MERVSWRSLMAFLVAVLALHPCFCYAEKAPNYSFVREATTAPRLSNHSYIVIGGGTAGCPLAATLSESANVLVLERGGSPYLRPGRTDKVNYLLELYNTSSDSYAQQFRSEDGVHGHRARVLGGGSVINAGFYSHADPEFVKEARLDEALVKQSYQWVEKKVVFESPVLQWQSAVKDGLLEVGVKPYNKFTYDHIKGTKIGATIFDRNDHRHTAADLLEYANPTNIKVYLHATVHKIITTETTGSRPKATGVIYKDATGLRHEAYLTEEPNSEIIVSSGAIGSPQLLMLSGIGPANQLKANRVKVVLDQPMVGQNMADNAMNGLVVPSPLPVEVSLLPTVGITQSGNYIEACSGLNLPPPPQEQMAKLLPTNLNKVSLHYSVSPCVFSFIMINIGAFINTRLQGGLIIQKDGRPLSTGHIELRNTDPNDNPKVWFNYFKEPQDVKKCVRGMETIISVINSKSFSRFRHPSMTTEQLLDLAAGLQSNARPRHPNTATSLEQFCKDTVLTFWHYHGSCKVGKVVDSDYRIIGVDSLRVIDASTFHVTPGTNPQATVMMLGR